MASVPGTGAAESSFAVLFESSWSLFVAPAQGQARRRVISGVVFYCFLDACAAILGSNLRGCAHFRSEVGYSVIHRRPLASVRASARLMYVGSREIIGLPAAMLAGLECRLLGTRTHTPTPAAQNAVRTHFHQRSHMFRTSGF